MVLNGLVCQDRTRLTSAERLPIQLNFSGVVLDAGVVEQRLHGKPAGEHAERGAVLGRLVEDEVGRPQAAGAGHVLDDDVGIAGQVLAEMAREVARVDVVARTRGIPDHHGGLLRAGWRAGEGGCDQGGNRGCFLHGKPRWT